MSKSLRKRERAPKPVQDEYLQGIMNRKPSNILQQLNSERDFRHEQIASALRPLANMPKQRPTKGDVQRARDMIVALGGFKTW